MLCQLWHVALFLGPCVGVVAQTAATASTSDHTHCRCTDHTASCWPSQAAWEDLNVSVGGRLLSGFDVASPLEACHVGADRHQDCVAALNVSTSTEFWNSKFPGGFQNSGFRGAWTAGASQLAVAAVSVTDVQAAVRFAKQHNLRVVVKGAGHDYMGRNLANGSLLIWTRQLEGILWGAANATVTVGAGVLWEEVYTQAQERGVFVLGGHCPSVGAAGGFPLGGGYGPLSRFYGSAADNMVSATVVSSQGEVMVANSSSNADLFWALRGGGGGSFGIVTSITYRVWPAPTTGGVGHGTVSCAHEPDFDTLLQAFVRFLPSLATPNWGGVVAFSTSPLFGIVLSVQYVGISVDEAQTVLDPFVLDVNHSKCTWTKELKLEPYSMTSLSNGTLIANLYPYSDAYYSRTGDADVDSHWSTGSFGLLNAFWLGQASRYVTLDLFNDPVALASKWKQLLKIFPSWNLRLNKGLLRGGGQTGQNVSNHPSARNAVALLLGGAIIPNYFPDLPETRETLQALRTQYTPGAAGPSSLPLCSASDSNFTDSCLVRDTRGMDDADVRDCWTRARACFSRLASVFNDEFVPVLQDAFPTGSYMNEANMFEPDWQDAFWGSNYPRLRRIKQQIDPEGLWICHHCVGSEHWSSDGNCRIADVNTRVEIV